MVNNLTTNQVINFNLPWWQMARSSSHKEYSEFPTKSKKLCSFVSLLLNWFFFPLFFCLFPINFSYCYFSYSLLRKRTLGLKRWALPPILEADFCLNCITQGCFPFPECAPTLLLFPCTVKKPSAAPPGSRTLPASVQSWARRVGGIELQDAIWE